MSWRPSPSFGEPKTKKTTSDTQKATSTALAPAFVMKDIEISTQKGEESDPAIEPPSALRNQSFIRTVQRPTKEAMKSSGIRWNHQIFLVENDELEFVYISFQIVVFLTNIHSPQQVSACQTLLKRDL